MEYLKLLIKLFFYYLIYKLWKPYEIIVNQILDKLED